MDISIVIPVFNGEPFVSRAIESCLSQADISTEIIVVNDASTDHTSQMAHRYATEHDNVTVIDKPHNEQLLEARRTGVMAATAPLVCFLDADDELPPHFCSSGIEVLQSRQADMVAGSLEIVFSSDADHDVAFQSALEQRFSVENATIEHEDICRYIFQEDRCAWSVVGRIYSRELLIKTFSFIPSQRLYISEDALITFIASTLAGRLACSPTIESYRYSVGTGGTTSNLDKISLERFLGFCDVHKVQDCIRAYLAKHDAANKYGTAFQNLSLMLVSDPINRLRALSSTDLPHGFAALVDRWQPEDVIARIANYHHGKPHEICAHLAPALPAVKTKSSGTVALVLDDRPSFETLSNVHSICNAVHALGLEPIILLNSENGWPSPQIPAPDTQALTLPRCDLSCYTSVRERLATLRDIVSKRHVNALLFVDDMSRTSPWDMLMARCLGAFCGIVRNYAFTRATCTEHAARFSVQECFALSNAIICSNPVDAAYWQLRFENVFLEPLTSQAPFSSRIIAANHIASSGHAIVWYGDVTCNRQVSDALYILRTVRHEIPDAMMSFETSSQRSDPSAPVHEHIQAMAHAFGVEEAIVLQDTEAGCTQPVRNASLFISTERFSSQNGCILHALASGLPCITYSYALESFNHFTDMQTAFSSSIDERGLEAFAHAALTILKNPTVAQQMSQAGKCFAHSIDNTRSTRFWKHLLLDSDSALFSSELFNPTPYQSDMVWEYQMRLNDDLSERLRQSEAQARELREEIIEANRQHAADLNELTWIRGSHSFRIGLALTKPFRAIKVFCKNRLKKR